MRCRQFGSDCVAPDKVLTVYVLKNQQLEMFLLGDASSGENLYESLLRMIKSVVIAGNGYCLKLPPVRHLMKLTGCTIFDLMKALLCLNEQGYDYQFSGFDKPLWIMDPYTRLLAGQDVRMIA